MDFRDWIIAMGVMVIIGLVIDACRRVFAQKNRKNNIKFGIESIKGIDEEHLSELPNGGARVQSTRTTPTNQSSLDTPIPLDEPPLSFQTTSEFQKNTAHLPAATPQKSTFDLAPPSEPIIPDSNTISTIPSFSSYSTQPSQSVEKTESISKRKSPSATKSIQSNTLTQITQVTIPSYENQDIITMHLMAKKEQLFSGDHVLQMLLDHGLRWGTEHIFHYVQAGQQDENWLFSVLNGVKPGTFNPGTMRTDQFRVLTFLMTLPGPKDPQNAFQTMLKVLHSMSKQLHADIKDDQYGQMTTQTLSFFEEKIMDYCRPQWLKESEITII